MNALSSKKYEQFSLNIIDLPKSREEIINFETENKPIGYDEVVF